MSPEKARVFVAEDKKQWQEVIKEYLEEAGHSVVLQATTFRDALAGTDLLEKLQIDVAVLDGNLTPVKIVAMKVEHCSAQSEKELPELGS